jgi:hypothetical protein
MKKFLLLSILVLVLIPTIGQADTVESPILVVDRCPEFCPPGWTPPVEPVVDRCPEFCPGWEPPVEICAQVLIPVPGRPGYWYTDSCKKTIIRYPSETESNKKPNSDSVEIPIPVEEPAKVLEEEPVPSLPETFVCGLGLATSMEPPHNLFFEVMPEISNLFVEVENRLRVKNVLTLIAV